MAIGASLGDGASGEACLQQGGTPTNTWWLLSNVTVAPTDNLTTLAGGNATLWDEVGWGWVGGWVPATPPPAGRGGAGVHAPHPLTCPPPPTPPQIVHEGLGSPLLLSPQPHATHSPAAPPLTLSTPTHPPQIIHEGLGSPLLLSNLWAQFQALGPTGGCPAGPSMALVADGAGALGLQGGGPLGLQGDGPLCA